LRPGCLPGDRQGRPAERQGGDEEADYHRVYQEFIETKQRLGETIEGVTFDKFVAKLRASRSQVLRGGEYKAVRFQVYVKDGKAALKATPVT